MPHAMTEAFTLEDPPADAAGGANGTVTSGRPPVRQQESETPNERAMRAATAARRAVHTGKRQQG